MPRVLTGFWDQKEHCRGLGSALSQDVVQLPLAI